MAEEVNDLKAIKEEVESLGVIGIFLSVFGAVVIFAILFTTTFQGKITNLISGGLLLLCGGIALLKARAKKKQK